MCLICLFVKEIYLSRSNFDSFYVRVVDIYNQLCFDNFEMQIVIRIWCLYFNCKLYILLSMKDGWSCIYICCRECKLFIWAFHVFFLFLILSLNIFVNFAFEYLCSVLILMIFIVHSRKKLLQSRPQEKLGIILWYQILITQNLITFPSGWVSHSEIQFYFLVKFCSLDLNYVFCFWVLPFKDNSVVDFSIFMIL